MNLPITNAPSVTDRYRYEVKITGDAPPFKWQIDRTKIGATPGTVQGKSTLTEKGESDSLEDAMFDAAEVAHRDWVALRHAATVRTEVLFDTGDESDAP